MYDVTNVLPNSSPFLCDTEEEEADMILPESVPDSLSSSEECLDLCQESRKVRESNPCSLRKALCLPCGLASAF